MTVLYCVIDTGGAAPPSFRPGGLPGAAPPRTLPIAGSLNAVVATVPDEEYDSDTVSAKLRDMDWVSKAAIAHEQVIDHAMATAAAVLPMKLLTLFSGDERLVADLKKQRARLAKAAAHVAGCEEYGFRVTAAGGDDVEPTAERPSSGLAFLERKKEARDQARERAARRVRFARDAWDAMAAAAHDAVQRPIAGEAIERPLLDAAFLVRRDAREAFAQASERLRKEAGDAGCAIALTGPWPPYHFVQV